MTSAKTKIAPLSKEGDQKQLSANPSRSVLADSGDYEAAEPMIREALTLDRQIHGDEAVAVAYELDNLGNLLTDKGKYEEAEKMFVAIKVLPEEFASAPSLARFEREAKLLASLNHPNIASIHGFDESDGRNALVLELVEGPALPERIAQGPIPVDEAIAIAKQIAEPLEAGHEAGVIHRDLKPANIKLKEDGTVKVLDYGLAKALEGETASGADSELSQSPTLTRQGTQVGVILGTAAYMSPEQAKGKRVDKRADVWAFGAVCYEMVTGKRAFEGIR